MLFVSLALTAIGMLVADIPDLIRRPLGPVAAISDMCYVVAAVLAIATLLRTLYGHLEPGARLAGLP